MTLNEIAYNIKNIVEGGIHGTDSNISIRQIKSMIHYHRTNLLMQYTDMGRYLSEKMMSFFNTSAPADGVISLDNIEFVGFPNNRGLVSISLWPSSDLNEEERISVPVGNEADKEFFVNSRFTGNSFRAYVGRGNLYIYEGTELFTDTNYRLVIKYIATKPEDGAMGYPIPDELVPALTETILRKEFNTMLSVGNDPTNNSVDDKLPGHYASVLASQAVSQPKANARSRAKRTR
tara:strand:- start:627 stop:1328 length:702 start_codon:yes stop_codon:yes gene_type:complete